jgi:hypothetical protein
LEKTLVTAFEDRNLRMDIFKNIIMKYEIDNCRNQSLVNALVDGNRENYRILIQVWEIVVSSFNGIEVCYRNVVNDLNEVRIILANNQSVISKQNIVQMNFLTKIDERLQRGLKAVGIRITRGFENEITLKQVQIVTQLEQRINVMNINIQKVKKKLNESLET